jgi:hypothetical protein
VIEQPAIRRPASFWGVSRVALQMVLEGDLDGLSAYHDGARAQYEPVALTLVADPSRAIAPAHSLEDYNRLASGLDARMRVSSMPGPYCSTVDERLTDAGQGRAVDSARHRPPPARRAPGRRAAGENERARRRSCPRPEGRPHNTSSDRTPLARPSVIGLSAGDRDRLASIRDQLGGFPVVIGSPPDPSR